MSFSTPQPLPSFPLTTSGEATSRTAEAQTSAVRALTQQLARGNEAAFAEFHERYFDRLYHLLLVICRGQEAEARDALQQTFLRVLRYARPFDSEEVFWSWLTALARSAARDAGRKHQRYLGMLERFAEWWSGPVNPPKNEEVAPLPTLLREAVEELPANDRILIMGKYFSGSTVRELAAATGETEKAVESRLVRLRRQLRERVLKKLSHL